MLVLGLKSNDDLIVSFIDSVGGGGGTLSNKVSACGRQIPPSAECPEIQMKTKRVVPVEFESSTFCSIIQCLKIKNVLCLWTKWLELEAIEILYVPHFPQAINA